MAGAKGIALVTEARGFLEAAARASDLTRPGRVAGEITVGVTHNNMMAGRSPGENWPPLSPSTLLNRARGRNGTRRVFTTRGALTKAATRAIASAQPLIWSRRLFLSMTHRAFEAGFLVGSNLIYASRVTEGSKPGDGGPPTPRRWPFGLTESQKELVKSIYRRFIARGQV
jgi:hypothetical protein